MRDLIRILMLGAWLLGTLPVRAENVLLIGSDRQALLAWEEQLYHALPDDLSFGMSLLGETPLNQRCPEARLVLTLGEAAATAAAQACPQARIWASGLPATALTGLIASAPERISGTPSDVPGAAQAAVLAALRPPPLTVAVPYSPSSKRQAMASAEALRAAGITPILLPTAPESQPLRPLREVLGDVQAVLALPDPALYHEGLLKHWLLMTAREGVPMIGGIDGQDVRRGIAAAAIQARAPVLEAALLRLSVLLDSGAMPAPARVNVIEVIQNPLMLERLGLRLETAP